MLTHQQRRLRRECNVNCGVPFSEKTCNDKKIKLQYYGTIQDLYDEEYKEYKEEF